MTDESRIDELLVDDDEDEEEPEVANGFHVASPATPQIQPSQPRKRINKPRLKAQGLGAPERPRFHNQEAELLWPEVLESLKHLGKTPYDIRIRVSRMTPEKHQLGVAFDGASVMGSEAQSPGDQLIEFVIDNYHLHQNQQGPMRYDISFMWSMNGQVYTRGILSLPSQAEILSLRRARMTNAANAGATKPTGVGYAPPPQYPPQPTYQQPYYPPPPAAAPSPQGHDMNELAYLRGVLTEAISASRENRAPVIQPPPAPAPPQGLTKKDVAETVVETLQALGLVTKPGAVGVGAPPPAVQTAPSQFVTGFKQFVGQAREFKEAMSMMASMADGEDDETPETPPAAPIVATPAKPEDTLPFAVVEVPGAKWPDGTPVQFAANKETGSIDWMGVAMSNPHAATKAMEYGGKILEAGAAALAKFAGLKHEGAAEVVSQVPVGALNAGVGAVMQPAKKDDDGSGSAPATPTI